MAIDCLILGPAYPYRGGIADTNHAFAKELTKQGVTTEIWTFTKLYPNIIFPGKTQFDQADKEFSFKIVKKIHAYNPFSWKKISDEINSLAPKRVVFRYWTPLLAIAWGNIANKLDKSIKRIALVDNWTPHEPKPWDKSLNHYFSDKMNLITTLSESVHSEIISEVNIPVNKGFHPINDDLPEIISKKEARERLKLNQHLNYILFFGLIRSYKGVDLLIEAFKYLNQSNQAIKLLIVGEFYEDETLYKKLIQKLNLTNQIEITNEFVSFELARDYFCAADLVVQPYKTATQSGVTPVGYFYETPLIVTDLEGLKTPIINDKSGKVSSKNPKDIAKAIIELIQKENLELAQKNIRKSKTSYSWRSFTEQWITFIKQN
jgi:glycosyltransferase involved in cell wall biosynthesis